MTKNKQSSHPDRSDLIRAIQHGDTAVARHLDHCAECRALAELLMIAATTSDDRHEWQIESQVQRLASIPALKEARSPRLVGAELTGDTWSGQTLAEVRNDAYGIERRLDFKAAGFRLELVVDRLGDKWDCSLRVSRRGRPVSYFVAAVGGQDLLPSDVGFFHWSAEGPPKRVEVRSPEVVISSGEIQW